MTTEPGHGRGTQTRPRTRTPIRTRPPNPDAAAGADTGPDSDADPDALIAGKIAALAVDSMQQLLAALEPADVGDEHFDGFG